jgi:hypothetical protein
MLFGEKHTNKQWLDGQFQLSLSILAILSPVLLMLITATLLLILHTGIIFP